MSSRYLNIVLIATVSSVMLLSGCGSSTSTSSFLGGLQVSSSEQNGDLWVSLSAQVNTGGMLLASLNVPVVNPKNPSQEYGDISLTSNLCPSTGLCTNGGGTLSISVDMSAISHLQMSGNDLPNGTPLPVGGTAASSIIGIPIGSGGAELYVGLGSGIAIIGVAIPFSALNGVGTYLPGVDIFDAFNMGGATGVVGIFAGSAADTTGFALFADLSSLLSGILPSPTPSPSAAAAAIEAHSLAAVNSADLAAAQSAKPVDFVIPHVSSSKRSALMYKLWEASANGTVLKYKQ